MVQLELPKGVDDLSKETVEKKFLIAMCIGMALCGICWLISIHMDTLDPNSRDYNVWCTIFTFPFMLMVLSFLYPACIQIRKRTICRTLAGLEMGVIHCADDIVVLMGLGRKTANFIIMGEYDYLMTESMYCRYLPY